jgi:hypothetical protein
MGSEVVVVRPPSVEDPDLLLGLAGLAEGNEHPGRVLAGELEGIEALVFGMVVGPGGDEGGSDYGSAVPPALDGGLEDVAGTALLVAAVELAVSGDPSEEAPMRAPIVGELLDESWPLGVLRKHGHHHCILVGIHPDMNLGRRRYGRGSVLLAGATSSVACDSSAPATWGANALYARRAGPSISSVPDSLHLWRFAARSTSPSVATNSTRARRRSTCGSSTIRSGSGCKLAHHPPDFLRRARCDFYLLNHPPVPPGFVQHLVEHASLRDILRV